MNPLLLSTGIIGFMAVALGAFGAHGLEDRLTSAAKGWWATATLYALVHAAAALALAVRPEPSPTLSWAGAAFLLGVLIFSGSLYAMALGAPRWFGMITPIGGLSFLTGWGLIILYGIKSA
ncbi:MAG: DUF423 domain-containing protein [Alphaproteobacteria bacterium]|nr:DUF423 domain-containing protein [Marinicaulis sp.]NOX94957.1 DUF423 domain-containing protein [Alphaproteobacteria bacterium]